MQFDEFWSRAISFLKNGLDRSRNGREDRLFITGWRAGKGFTDEKFPVRDINDEKITCLTIHAGKPIEVPREDMETLYSLWDEYINGTVSKLEVVEKVPRTTYAIALMKYLKEGIA